MSNDVESLAPGTGCYAAFLTPKGKMLGDVRILNAGDELLLDTERAALQALFNMIRRFSIGYQVELHKRTVECGLLSLIGPDAARLAGADGLPSEEHAHIPLSIGGIQGARDPHRRGLGSSCTTRPTRRLCAPYWRNPAQSRLARPRPSASGSSMGDPATGSTSTTP